MTYSDFFRRITKQERYDYQERLADLLLGGRSIVLRAPTGAGKTWAVVAPFLYSLWKGERMADRLLYALPLRSLATSLHETVLAAVRRNGELFGEARERAVDRSYSDGALYGCLQIGGQGNDPFLESDLVFTTMDQLLSSYLFLPVALPNRLGNINAGALVGGLVVFDEVHLLDMRRALGTAIEMLDRLKRETQFVLMTATLSDAGVEWLAKRLGAEPFCIPNEEVRAMPSQRSKQRRWQWAERPITAQAVQESHRGGRTVALVNSVRRAQELYQMLDTMYEGTATKRLLLHGRFYPEDRRRVEEQLQEYLGPEASRSDVILVTTQVIEAGIDISADCLHTEVAPMNALIQRAGRVARYADRNRGTVTVYGLERNEKGREKFGPYWDSAEPVRATMEVLQGLPKEGRTVDFEEEQKWVDGVHGRAEQVELERYENPWRRRESVHDAMDSGDRGKLTELVRDVDSVNVLVTAEPESVNFTGRNEKGVRIGWPRLLSVGRPALRRAEREGWVVKGAVAADGEGPGLEFEWLRLESVQEIMGHWLLAIHPDYAYYDSSVGLVLGRKGSAKAVEYEEVRRTPRYQYEFETWRRHAERIVYQGREMRAANRRGAEALAKSGCWRGRDGR